MTAPTTSAPADLAAAIKRGGAGRQGKRYLILAVLVMGWFIE